MFELVAVSREHRKQRRQTVADGATICIGRQPVDGLAIPWDKQISREHVEFVISGGKASVRKLKGARNAIHFNGRTPDKFKLRPGDSFRIGLTTFQFNDRDDADSSIGEKYGEFTISKTLGHGALGILFGGSNRKANLQGAVRVIEPSLIRSDVNGEQFLNQVALLSESTPGGIGLYFGSGRQGLQWYSVREYVAGTSLEDVIRKKGTIVPPRALEIVQQVARQLTDLHELRLCHGNLKPSNVIVRVGTTRLVDLAFGCPVATRIQAKDASASCKTYADYVPPEVLEAGDCRDIRSDMYSLGCIWFTLVTGQPVFPGNNLAMKLRSHGNVEPDWDRLFDAQVPDSSIDVIRRLLAKSPSGRYDNPAELLSDLTSRDVAGLYLDCEGCGKRYRIGVGQEGKRLRCRECGSVIAVPHRL